MFAYLADYIPRIHAGSIKFRRMWSYLAVNKSVYLSLSANLGLQGL